MRGYTIAMAPESSDPAWVPDPNKKGETAKDSARAAVPPVAPLWVRGLVLAGGMVLMGALVFFDPATALRRSPVGARVSEGAKPGSERAGEIREEPLAAPARPGVSGLEMIRPISQEPAASSKEESPFPVSPAPSEPSDGGFADLNLQSAPALAPGPEVAPEPLRRRLQGFEPGSTRGVKSWRAPRNENAEEQAPTSQAFVARQAEGQAAPKPAIRQALPPADAPVLQESPQGQPRKPRGRPSSRSGGGTSAPAVQPLPQVPQTGPAAPTPPAIPAPAPVETPRTAPLAAGSMGDERGSQSKRGPMPPNTLFRCGPGLGQWRNTLANTCSRSKEDCKTTDPRGTCLIDGPEPELLGK